MRARRAAGAAACAAVALAAAGCGGSAPAGSAAPAAGTAVAAPPAASAVAAEIGAAGFTDCGPAPLGGVTDGGVAELDGKRVGIDVFPGQPERDAWLATAAKLGVAPFRESADWVAYVAVTQAGPACGSPATPG